MGKNGMTYGVGVTHKSMSTMVFLCDQGGSPVRAGVGVYADIVKPDRTRTIAT